MSHLLWYPGHALLKTDIVRAEGCYVYDSRGNRYVDLESGVWCMSIGHGHPRILRVLAEQSARIAHNGFNYTSPVVDDTALEVMSLLGHEGGRCVFLCSGSETVEYGVRVAQMLAPPSRPLLLTMADSYFGAYGSASQKRASEWHIYEWLQCPACGADCDGGCARFAEIPFDRIGGFLLEPGSSSGLVRFPPAPLIQRIAKTIQDGGGFVLVNEVTTGIGRTGAWFGFQHYGIAPDIVATGKGIGNGYPVSVASFAPRVIERLGDRPVKYAQSHQNDPLGAAVAREVLRVIAEEGLIERAREMGEFLVRGLRAIRDRRPRVSAVRARGLLTAVDLEDDEAASISDRVHRDLARAGFLLARRPGLNVLRIDPPLTIPRAEIEAFLAAFEEALA